MKEKLFAKLHSRAGETIAETLIALLIASLALVMLAGAIASAVNVITRSNETMAEYYNQDNALAQRASAVSGSATVTVGTGTRSVTYYVNDTFSKAPVVSYTHADAATP